jgi:hypothetical protein
VVSSGEPIKKMTPSILPSTTRLAICTSPAQRPGQPGAAEGRKGNQVGFLAVVDDGELKTVARRALPH